MLALFLGVCLAPYCGATIIPDDRTAPWDGNVGVPGGIPNRTTVYVNVVTDLGADPTGVTDCSSIIQEAVANCPANQVVYIPAGRFRMESQVHWTKSDVTIRGAGMGVTTLYPANNNNIFLPGSATWPDPSTWVSISSGATKGSNTITVADTTAFVVGAPLATGPIPLPVWAHNLAGPSQPDTWPSMRVYSKILSKTSTTITFDPPLPFDFSGMNPAALVDATPMIQGFGIESMTLDISGTTAGWPIWFSQAWGCWVKDVEIKGAYSRQMLWDVAVRCEVRGCYTHDVQGTGPNHEGIIIGPGSWNLIEDNICNKGGASPIVLEDGVNPASCNVIGYNYVVNTDAFFWDISFNHGSGSILNLAEGNVIQSFKDDGYYGSSSLNTLFRNYIAGETTTSVTLKHMSNYYNIVGNVLGTDGVPATYETETVNYGYVSIYELGFPNIGNTYYLGTFGPTTPPDYHLLSNNLEDPDNQTLDYNVKTTILRHGNFDYYNHAVVWDPSITDHTIPDSLYYSSQPSWWPNFVAWPPIGPDYDPMVSEIPAQIRFLTQSTPTPTPTANPTPTPTSTPTPAPTATPTETPTPTPTPHRHRKHKR